MSGARPDTWMPFDPCVAALVPARAGVYVIYFDDEPVYVGQSNNLRARLARHNFRHGYARNIITPWGEFPDDVEVRGKLKLSRRYGDWAMWELRLIRALRPRFNRQFCGVRASSLS